jgi:hypothetical protein
MNELGEWAKGKPLGLVVIMAQQAAVGVEALEWLRSIKVEQRLGNDKPPFLLKERQCLPSIRVSKLSS